MKDLIFCGIGSALETEFNNNCAIYLDKKDILIIDPNENSVKYLINKKILTEKTKNVTIAITHTHSDHISGLGQLIWQCAIRFKIVPIIISNSITFQKSLKKLLTLMGIDKSYYIFSENNVYNTANVCIEMIKTKHTKDLECFGIILKDDKYKIYYSGDTNDFKQISNIILDKTFNRIYLELSHYPKSHIEYNDIKKLKNLNKIIAMHLTKEIYEEIIKDGVIEVAKEVCF